MRWWKILGLAGLIGGVAIGVTVGARQVQRSRREYVDGDIHDLRDRLHARFAEAGSANSTGSTGDSASVSA